jgi:hypothetical protein
MAVNKGEKANMSGEAYGKYHRGGVEGPSGQARKGVAEKTVVANKMDQSDSGSVESDLTEKASALYQAAVHNRGDKLGDKALTER